MLKGQAKVDYQREYMREYRRKKQVVRPSEVDPVRPKRLYPSIEEVRRDEEFRLRHPQLCTDKLDAPELDADGNVMP